MADKTVKDGWSMLMKFGSEKNSGWDCESASRLPSPLRAYAVSQAFQAPPAAEAFARCCPDPCGRFADDLLRLHDRDGTYRVKRDEPDQSFLLYGTEQRPHHPSAQSSSPPDQLLPPVEGDSVYLTSENEVNPDGNQT